MKKIIWIFVIGFAFISGKAQNLNLKDIVSGEYRAKNIGEIISSEDGEHYFGTDDKKSKIIKYSYKTGAAVDTVFDTGRARSCTFDTFEGFLMSPDEKRLLVYRNPEYIYRRSFKADYYYYDIRRNLVTKLTENVEKQRDPVFSRDGRMLAYVLDNNIWLAKFDFETESQVTKDGELDKIINGSTDWVYEEEFGITSLMDFSPDGKLLAFVKFDESDVKSFSFQVYANQLYPDLFTFKYPKAGEKNSEISCNVFDIESRTIRKMEIENPSVEYIPRIEFVSDTQLAIMTLNRNQNDFNLYFANPRSSVSKLILNEKNERYIDEHLPYSFRFLPEQFIYLSEKDGYNHIYLYSNAGVQQSQLTSGAYDVTSILAYDKDTKTVFYTSTEESPLKREIYRVDIVKGNKKKLSDKSGYNTAKFSKTGKYYINTWSDAQTPSIITVNDANGKQLRVLEENKTLAEKVRNVSVPQKEFITVKAADGQDLNAWIMKPLNFSSSSQYPLLMVQYSGPGSQQVLDRFDIDWVDYLVTQGYVVACVDGRGTGARGEEFKKGTYLNMGIKESDDQIAAAKYFGSLPYINKDKIAIWGWSYGGYTTLMSMSRSDVFKAGIAIAPVTNWKYYDSIYTERFMRTPQQNGSGYTDGSPVSLADRLSGRLLLIHGSADDNVHFQNTMEYANTLIEADKQFDMFVFTDKDHSIRGSHNREYLYKKIIDFLQTNL